jgi:hypothetical protein
MSKTIINLTQHSILQEIERVLENYPDHPCQQAFAHPGLRQELLIWVLNRIPNVFTLLEESEDAVVHPTYARYCSDRQSCTEFVIHQGIQEILIQNQSMIERHIPAEESAEQPMSHWFG